MKNGSRWMGGRAHWVSGAALFVGMASGCGDSGQEREMLAEPGEGEPVGMRQSPVVYGSDDRKDLFEYSDLDWAEQVAGFTVALMSAEVVEVSPEGAVSFVAPTLAETGVCPDERFAQQRAAAFCSGTLIGPDLVLTAAHCVPDASACEDTLFVFGYQMEGAEALRPVTTDDVFSCAEVLVQEQDFDYADHAIVRLDRPTGRESARLAPGSYSPAEGALLLVHGFPSGLPLKIDDGGVVLEARAFARDYFVASLDTATGSNGAGVFDATTRELVGIEVTGELDSILDEVTGCFRVNLCPDGACDGQIVEHASRAIEALCAAGVPTPLCPCGDGICDAGGGETSATCAADCGAICGDGACNGAEGATDCPEDCGTCGNAACDEGEDEGTCCTDCGCSGASVCTANACVPAQAGDTCADAAELRPVGRYVVSGDSTAAIDDYAGSCAEDSAGPDRVYSITLAEATWIEADVTGFDTVLYVRSDCADPLTETFCDDDSGPPGLRGSRIAGWLAPGTHYIVVDAYDAEVGLYELTVSFGSPASNDTCDAPIDIPASGTQVITAMLGEGGGRNDYQGTCGGEGPDHVYSFTTSDCVDLSATTEGLDSVLYLRTACSSVEPADELACNDDRDTGDRGSAIEVSTLAAGTHHLIVDGYRDDVMGAYTLTVAFSACVDEGEPPPEM